MYCNFITKIILEGETPEWVTIFKSGWVEIEGEGQALVDEKAFNEILASFKRRGNDLVIDYEHQTLNGVQAPAAGWIKELKFNKEEGISARVEWTSKGADYLKTSEYRYHSPVFMVRQSDKRVVSLHSVALTNSPKTNNIKPILAKLNLEGKGKEIMDYTKIAEALKIPGVNDENEIIIQIAKLNEQAEKSIEKETISKDILAALDLDSKADASMVVASIHAIKQAHQTMVSKAEFDALRKELQARDATEAVDMALKAGKLAPTQKEWALEYAKSDIKGFNVFIAKAPVIIPVENLPDKKDKTEKDPDIDEATKEIASKMGISIEDMKKYGGDN